MSTNRIVLLIFLLVLLLFTASFLARSCRGGDRDLEVWQERLEKYAAVERAEISQANCPFPNSRLRVDRDIRCELRIPFADSDVRALSLFLTEGKELAVEFEPQPMSSSSNEMAVPQNIDSWKPKDETDSLNLTIGRGGGRLFVHCKTSPGLFCRVRIE